jgi:hypothetical protein
MAKNINLKESFKKRLPLFLTGFTQVYFVAINTYFLAREIYFGVFISAFIISMIWSFNIKRIAFGSINDRLVYSFGATLGSISGLWSSLFIASIL